MTGEMLFIFVIYGIVMSVFGVIIGYLVAKFKFYKDVEKLIKIERKMALSFSRSVIKGKISEQMFPLTPFFKYKLSDARFLGSPIDYIVFNGYSDIGVNGGEIKEIIFIEVKTGNSQLSNTEIAVKNAIDNKRVKFEIVYIK